MTRLLIWAPPATHVAVWKNPPEILLTALQPKQIELWRQRNTWADSINMIIFTDDDPPSEVKMSTHCYSYAPHTGKAPHIVVNCPPDALPALRRVHDAAQVRSDDESVRAVTAYKSAVHLVTLALRDALIGWIQPESDHAMGALVAARTRGFAVGYSQRQQIDSFGVISAASMGVSVRTLGSIQAKGVEQ